MIVKQKTQNISYKWKRGNIKRKNIRRLKRIDGSFLKSNTEIFNEFESFYRELYTTNWRG